MMAGAKGKRRKQRPNAGRPPDRADARLRKTAQIGAKQRKQWGLNGISASRHRPFIAHRDSSRSGRLALLPFYRKISCFHAGWMRDNEKEKSCCFC